jgi:hypothetical protein
MTESVFTYGAPSLKLGEGASEEIGYDLARETGPWGGFVAVGTGAESTTICVLGADAGLLLLGEHGMADSLTAPAGSLGLW